jgi:queuine tRNA-ribosyltransferase
VHFVDLDGNRKKTLFTPERSIRLQFDLGADLVICLDDCPSPDSSAQEVEDAVERTIHWAERCRAEFDRQIEVRNLTPGPRPLLFGVVQGGYDRELRARCAEGLLPLGFDGFGFGGWPLTPDGELAHDILAYTAELTPEALPRFALGVGKPEHIVRCYLAGWRIFDCVLPTRDARHGRLYTFRADHLDEVDLRATDFYRFLYIRDEVHRRQHGPISTACDCPCCQSYSLAYLHHLFGVGDPLGLRLATLHNLRFYTQLMERVSAL